MKFTIYLHLPESFLISGLITIYLWRMLFCHKIYIRIAFEKKCSLVELVIICSKNIQIYYKIIG